ncbi:MAG: NAD(P)H-binding protein [Nitrospirae bacterium]|nr:NAD(P)H-binding protein [Candidatus Troglogloeales bacterium]
MKIFVYLATGKVSSALVSKLVLAGHEVFAGSRSPDKITKKERLHAVRIDSQKPTEGLEVLEKVDAAFLIVPPTVVDGYSVLKPLIEKAKTVQLRKFVLMTAMGVNYAPTEAPLRKLELTVEASGLQYNILRPNWFMQNFHTFWISGILKDQKIYFPGGNAKTSFIDTRDISAVASELLTSNQFTNQAFDLTGGEALTHDEVAAKISKATGKKIEYVDITSEAFQQALLAAGLPTDYVGFLAFIAGILKSGGATPVSESVYSITGKSPITFDEYATDFKAKWDNH